MGSLAAYLQGELHTAKARIAELEATLAEAYRLWDQDARAGLGDVLQPYANAVPPKGADHE